jgi:hypothetical protein
VPFHINGLTPTQFDVLKNLGRVVSRSGYYLAGGTAVSIYFGHRRSVDLDWFINSSLSDPLDLAQFLRDQGIYFVTDSTERGTLHGTVENIQVSFLEYHYDLLQPLVPWKEGECHLASLDDLCCMKLAAVAQRGSRKDFIDVFVLAQQYKPLPELLKLYQKKYQTENIAPVLMGLVYFDDAEEEPDPPLWSEKWLVVKQKFSEWVRQIE